MYTDSADIDSKSDERNVSYWRHCGCDSGKCAVLESNEQLLLYFQFYFILVCIRDSQR